MVNNYGACRHTSFLGYVARLIPLHRGGNGNIIFKDEISKEEYKLSSFFVVSFVD